MNNLALCINNKEWIIFKADQSIIIAEDQSYSIKKTNVSILKNKIKIIRLN